MQIRPMGIAKRSLPFQGMPSGAWTRLAYAALCACYLLQLGLEVSWHNTCGHLAIDYCALWSAGRVANSDGYAAIYNLATLKNAEAAASPVPAASSFAVSPIAYLPLFIVPFQLLAHLDPGLGYWLWASGSLLLLVLYLRFFLRRTGGPQTTMPMPLAAALLSLPVYWNFFNGQVNVWLVICVGEMLRTSLSGRRLLAGIWLGGLWLKPQLLILVIPLLLWQRAFKTLTGWTISTLLLLLISWLMIGMQGFERLTELWLGFGRGMPTNDIGIMMNWRMLGSAVSRISGPSWGTVLLICGMTATALGVFYLWRRPIDFHSEASMIAWAGLLAATTIVGWHSHVHMAMVLLPPLLYLRIKGRLPAGIFDAWILVPGALYFAAFVMAALIQAGRLPSAGISFVDFARGIGQFVMSVYLLIWCLKESRGTVREASAQSPQLA